MLTIHPMSAAAAPAPAPGTAVWIDLLDPTTEESARVAREWGVRVPSRESLQEIETSSRTRLEGEALYMSMPLAIRDGERGLSPVPLGFVLTARCLITVRFSEVKAFRPVIERCTADPQLGSAAMFVALIDAMVDFDADVLERLSSELAVISGHTFSANGERPVRDRRASRQLHECVNTVGLVGERLSRIRETLLGLERILGFVTECARDGQLFPPELRVHLKTARQDVASLVEFESHLSGKTQFLLDAVLGFINTEQNEIFKVLTIVSVVGIPPTLIASMYGMNFHNMPELGWRWGYPYGLILIAASTLVPILWFRRRGWW